MAKKQVTEEQVVEPVAAPEAAPEVVTAPEAAPAPEPAPAVKPISFGDGGYRDRPIDPKDLEGPNTVTVQAIASFAGIEGDKGPTSEPFKVSRQRYAELKANGLVELAK